MNEAPPYASAAFRLSLTPSKTTLAGWIQSLQQENQS